MSHVVGTVFTTNERRLDATLYCTSVLRYSSGVNTVLTGNLDRMYEGIAK